MPENKYLTVRLRLEQQRLYNWSSKVGLVEDVETLPSNGSMGPNPNMVLQNLEELYSLALDFIKCKDNGASLNSDDDESHVQLRDDNDGSLNQFPYLMRFMKEAKSAVPFIHGVPERLKWAGVYKDRYEKLINRLRAFNDILIDLVDSDARVAIRDLTRETDITILHLHTKIDELVNLTKALLPGIPPSSVGSSLMASHLSDLERKTKRGLLGLAYFKTINATVENNTYFTSYHTGVATRGKDLTEIKIACSDLEVFSVADDTSDRCEGEYHPSGGPRQRVWIEWREQDPILDIRPDNQPSCVDKLVALLTDPSKPDLLGVPHCLGYFNDPECKETDFRGGRLGFVFEKPADTTATPVSLRELLKTRSKPSLTERVALAKKISESLMALHSVNWLHKNLRSHNIIFFPGPGYTVDYSCPYLSGFGYASPPFSQDLTEKPSQNPEYDMYRHPRTRGLGPRDGRQGFRRAYDIYSLGVVLLEIANWQTIDSVLEIANPSSLDAATLARTQEQRLNREAIWEKLASDPGAKFRNATWNCVYPGTALGVDDSDRETDPYVAADVSKRFLHKVVKPLEEIQV